MLTRVFHAWERRLASVSQDRVVRPFDWGSDWVDGDGRASDLPAAQVVAQYADRVMSDTDAFYAVAPTSDYERHGDRLSYPSALTTPHAENNVVRARYFPARPAGVRGKRAVVVLPQWNADAGGHAGLCRWLAYAGISALRLTLPYHEERMPPELGRADYIVSSNIGRTLEVCRQAVLDARRAIHWLAAQGHDRIGILGTSLGSCLAMLTTAHEPLVRAAALNHISPYFADVVWEGLSTAHVRRGLDGAIPLELLRRCWLPISPQPFIDRVRGRALLLVYARYDLTFPLHLSREFVAAFRAQGVEHELAVLPCGHYSTGVSPFKWRDGQLLVSFLKRKL